MKKLKLSTAIAAMGSIVMVKGSKSATPLVAFRPGSAPTRIPPKVANTINRSSIGSASAQRPEKMASNFTRTKDSSTNRVGSGLQRLDRRERKQRLEKTVTPEAKLLVGAPPN